MIREQTRLIRSMGKSARVGTRCRILSAVGLILASLSGCATAGNGQVDANPAEAGIAAAAKPADNDTSGASPYVDPVVASASAQEATYADESSAPAPPGSGVAGLVTQSTGIRAGSVSIFSSSGQPSPQPQATVAAPTAPAETGSVNATAGSMFNAPAPTSTYTPGSCGRAEDGVPLSC